MQLTFLNDVNLIISYKFFLKNSRKLLTKNHYFYLQEKKLKREQNTHLMFVRAPKHFKSGKQILVFFNGIYRTKLNIKLKKSINYLNSLNSKVLYNFIKNYYNKKLINDTIISRITVSSSFLIKFNGRNYFFTINC